MIQIEFEIVLLNVVSLQVNAVTHTHMNLLRGENLELMECQA